MSSSSLPQTRIVQRPHNYLLESLDVSTKLKLHPLRSHLRTSLFMCLKRLSCHLRKRHPKLYRAHRTLNRCPQIPATSFHPRLLKPGFRRQLLTRPAPLPSVPRKRALSQLQFHRMLIPQDRCHPRARLMTCLTLTLWIALSTLLMRPRRVKMLPTLIRRVLKPTLGSEQAQNKVCRCSCSRTKMQQTHLTLKYRLHLPMVRRLPQ